METKQLTASDCWKILRRELTSAEVLRLFGCPEEELTEQVSALNYSESGMLRFTVNAYHELVHLKEIDADKIFNIRSAKYAGEADWHFDIGFKGIKMFRLSQENIWEDCSR